MKKRLFCVLKRTFDLFLSLIMLILLSPLFLILTLIIWIDDTAAAPFYLHRRRGKNDREIKIIKFRTMMSNAENLIDGLSEEQKKEYYENFKLKDDPRVTKLGALLRRTSLDELPQLINVFAGQLSFIGPRPVVEKEAQRYGENRAKFLSVKPGMTGYWAVNGRNKTTYEERMKLELYYVDHFSLGLDIKILFKTFHAVFSGDGAV